MTEEDSEQYDVDIKCHSASVSELWSRIRETRPFISDSLHIVRCSMCHRVPLFQWAFNWLEVRNMEGSGNKGLGNTMQSDTSRHDSTLKWWNGCEANTLPFNEGLLLTSRLFPLLPPRMKRFLCRLPLYFSMSSRLMGWGRLRLRGGKDLSPLGSHPSLPPKTPLTAFQLQFLSEIRAGQRSDPLIIVGRGWRGAD